MLKSTTTLDPITLELVKGRLRSARMEMESLLKRSAMSPFIREKEDFFVAFFDARGRMVFGTNLPLATNLLDCVLERFPPETMRPGDIYAYNDVYASRGAVSHTPDMVFAAPVFADGVLVGFSECWAHLWDIGGLYPGTISPDAREIYHEGIQMPPVRLYREGVLQEDLFRTFVNASRFPEMLRGDLRALLAACRLGEERMLEICRDFGRETCTIAMDAFIEQTREAVKRGIRQHLQDGTYWFEDWIDTDGATGRPHAVRMRMDKEGDRVVIDCSATDDQATGPINFLMHHSVPCLVLGLYMIAPDPTLLLNDGLVQAVERVVTREGSLLQPRHPAPVGFRSLALVRVQTTVFGLLAQATGGRSNAAQAPYGIAKIRGVDRATHRHFLCSEGLASGFGARSFADGIDAVYFVAQQNYPAEFMEAEFPVRVTHYALHTDSGGPGRYRGGCGVVRDVQLLADEATVMVRVDACRFPAWGTSGGQSGRPGRVLVNPGTGAEREIPAISDGTVLRKGDVIRYVTPGGGGWGHPIDRPVADVLRDVRGGFVSVEGGRRDYGVIIDPDTLAVDEEATARERAGRPRDPRRFHRGEYYDPTPF